MDLFLKTALILSGLALSFNCTPLKRTSDFMLYSWNMAYEAKLYSEMEENIASEETSTYAEETVAVVETVPEPVVVVEAESEVQTEEATASVVTEIPLYSVNGVVMPTELQVYLYNALAVRGIGWFYTYALLMAYQESNFNIYAENRNGLDKGLFQYRILYWGEYCAEAGIPAVDIFSPYYQIDVFAHHMAKRASLGCTVSDMISRHNMSDYGPYSQDYVNHVMSWESTLIKIN